MSMELLNYDETIQQLDSTIRLLEEHINLIEKGVMDDCLDCRKKDLIFYKSLKKWLETK